MTVLSWFAFATNAALREPDLCYSPPVPAPRSVRNPEISRHSGIVRVTHWITVICFLALLISGCEIVISHPRFYWGEVGNVMTRPIFTIPIPASRGTVPTGYHFVLPDQNGWSRYLHFQAAWALVLTGAIYGIFSVWSGHFRKDLLPARGDRSLRAFWDVIAKYLPRARPVEADSYSYNVIQRVTYLVVIFGLFPMVIWTGLAMSPGFDSAIPMTVNVLGGRQSARTLHFFVSGALVLFLAVHVAMVALSGFRTRMRAMISGRDAVSQERL